ncbi:tetratricopeptide repeat protein [Devosia sp.]
MLLLFVVPFSTASAAEEKAQIFATKENGFARLVLSFPGRMDLPAYRLKHENGVVAIEFGQPIDALLPDVAVALSDWISVAKIDPDHKGIRFGLRTKFILNRMEAGERLFIDLLPLNWQGLPPALPPAVVAELAERAKKAALLAEQRRKAEQAKILNPVATLRVGRNPTFLRVQFDWSVDTEAKFAMRENNGYLDFDWPVPVDLYDLKASLPKELRGVDNLVSAAGSRVSFKVADGIVPRFYATSKRQFIVDIDIASAEGIAAAIAADEAAKEKAKEIQDALKPGGGAGLPTAAQPLGSEQITVPSPSIQSALTPTVSSVGPTVRVSFPFEQDTAAAVFRRGDIVWMLFDTSATINKPAYSEALASIASGFEIIPAGGVKVVRLDLATERLATLGSEGRSWVLSLGDVLLSPTEPVAFSRQRDDEGLFRMTADLQRPSQVHLFRDPVVGDVLRVVTAFPPARGVARNQKFVDFAALRSIHGLVLKPFNDEIEVGIEGQNASIQAETGLTLSALETVRVLDSGNAAEFRGGFIDLAAAREDNPVKLVERREALVTRAAESEGRLRDVARLDLAQFFIANQFAPEAIGVLEVLDAELRTQDLRKRVRLTRSIADILAYRSTEALVTLNADTFSGEVDVLMWRSIAKVQSGDYKGARLDAIAAESVVESYPSWVRTKFLLSAIRAALETRDMEMALRYLALVEFAKLDPEQVSIYQLLQGRLAEAENRVDEALDTYGQVIAADIRPTRAEAVYRTLLLLDKEGRLDAAKATETLSAEVLLWRGDGLEADMQKLLAELYFRNKDYRNGFETVKQTAAFHPESPAINALLTQAQEVFAELYLNGMADELGAVDALTLYYDFRHLTPPGQRGDEMIRNLARRLVKVDLLSQAADLLEYQIDSRLKGVAQAQIAADLAVIRIADRDPEGALRVLNRTRLADLSPLLERQRRILEARALIDAGRQDLALDLLSKVQGRDADLLRVDGYWKSKNYAVAAELLEVIYSPTEGGGALTQPARMNVIKAAVGFVMVGDRLGLSRLRSKFGEHMAQTAEWPMFDFVTGEIVPSSVEFAKVAREISGLDSLNAFLASYREMYAAGDVMTPVEAAPPDEA